MCDIVHTLDQLFARACRAPPPSTSRASAFSVAMRGSPSGSGISYSHSRTCSASRPSPVSSSTPRCGRTVPLALRRGRRLRSSQFKIGSSRARMLFPFARAGGLSKRRRRWRHTARRSPVMCPAALIRRRAHEVEAACNPRPLSVHARMNRGKRRVQRNTVGVPKGARFGSQWIAA